MIAWCESIAAFVFEVHCERSEAISLGYPVAEIASSRCALLAMTTSRGFRPRNMPQASKQTIKVAGDEAGQRLDRVLAQAFADRAAALSRTRLKALILDGAVSIGARTIRD